MIILLDALMDIHIIDHQETLVPQGFQLNEMSRNAE
jgi:hypothetical protein